MSIPAGLPESVASVMGKKTTQQRQMEDLIEQFLRPEIAHRQRVYWPVQAALGPQVTRRAGEAAEKFFPDEAPIYGRAKERIQRAYQGMGRRLSGGFAAAGQAGRIPGELSRLERERGREITGFTKDIAIRRAERIPGERAQRISQAIQFAGGAGAAPGVPSVPGGGGAGGLGSLFQGMGKDAGQWLEFTTRMKELKRRQGYGVGGGRTNYGTAPLHEYEHSWGGK